MCQTDSITLCVVYAHPNIIITATYNEIILFNFLSNVSNALDKLIILGDFNFPDIDWDSLTSYFLGSVA